MLMMLMTPINGEGESRTEIIKTVSVIRTLNVVMMIMMMTTTMKTIVT